MTTLSCKCWFIPTSTLGLRTILFDCNYHISLVSSTFVLPVNKNKKKSIMLKKNITLTCFSLKSINQIAKLNNFKNPVFSLKFL